jgi:hypothetical protein
LHWLFVSIGLSLATIVTLIVGALAKAMLLSERFCFTLLRASLFTFLLSEFHRRSILVLIGYFVGPDPAPAAGR